MAIANQDEFKHERRTAQTIQEIREYARRHSINLHDWTDEEVLERWSKRPDWN